MNYNIIQRGKIEKGCIYNRNFALNVLSLNHIENATEDDIKWELDKWAKIFKATTWEELRMLAKDNETMTAVANQMSRYNDDERAQEEAIEREIFLRDFNQSKEEARVLREENMRVKAEFRRVSNEINRLRALLDANGIES